MENEGVFHDTCVVLTLSFRLDDGIIVDVVVFGGDEASTAAGSFGKAETRGQLKGDGRRKGKFKNRLLFPSQYLRPDQNSHSQTVETGMEPMVTAVLEF